MADYPHVPGFTVNVNDGGLVIPITASSATETLLILGPAPQGATDDPVYVADPSNLTAFATDATAVYGTEADRNLLTTAWKQAYDAGCRNIYLMRLAGTTAHDLFMSLHSTLALLSTVDIFDHIAVVGLYSDDAVTLTAGDVTTLGTGYAEGTADIVKELADFAMTQITSNNEVLAYIGRKPLGKLAPTLAEVRTYVDGAVDLGDSYNGFVSVVGGIDLAFKCGFDYADNGVAAYAGLATTLVPHSATTNKPLGGARLIYQPTLPMLDALGDKKYVTFRRRGAVAVPTLDVTAAADGSDFILLSTARILLAAVSLTRAVCEPFIGEGADNNSINAMETALHKTYKNMIAAKSILDYDFGITMTQQDFLNGRTTINLEVVPCLERRKIRLDITAKAQL